MTKIARERPSLAHKNNQRLDPLYARAHHMHSLYFSASVGKKKSLYVNKGRFLLGTGGFMGGEKWEQEGSRYQSFLSFQAQLLPPLSGRCCESRRYWNTVPSKVQQNDGMNTAVSASLARLQLHSSQTLF